ncbi:hypothetical protein BTA51_26195 [Hahella sp. CCB-MM4]|uniref:hypothetical protein n=1 Tax=Hahella sp. (strain CCB-MM4) TaxID=1926491 RepID=UPI000B9BB91F|nr:hypothetical protein [Hahella sp. CCB-MM4]OZG70462.1 hypothetical protein BTA51_26195 [Hahella sp. CCB-MM4]
MKILTPRVIVAILAALFSVITINCLIKYNADEYEYFQLIYSKPAENYADVIMTYGKIHRSVGWELAADRILTKFRQNCYGCRIITKVKLDTLTSEQSNIFKGRRVGLTYLKLESSDIEKADVRVFFPSSGDKFSLSECETFAKRFKDMLVNQVASCIGSREHAL